MFYVKLAPTTDVYCSLQSTVNEAHIKIISEVFNSKQKMYQIVIDYFC